MAIRALLIKPQKSGSQTDYVSVIHEPLGLLYLASFVRKYSKHVVALIDAQAEVPEINPIRDGLLCMGMSDAELRKRILDFCPRVVGITSLFNTAEAEVVNIARLVKTVSRDIVVVVGGLDAGVRHADYLRSRVIDLVVRGDGEETFLEILDHVDQGRSPTAIPGTCEMPAGGDIQRNPPRVRKVPFDDYPYPARDILPRALYDSPAVQRKSFSFSRDTPAMLIQMSRGCVYQCVFCDIIAIQNKWLGHSPAYVLGEMEHCRQKYGTREFVFVDDNFMIDQKRVIEICRQIIERRWNISIDIMPGIAVWRLNEEMIDLLIEAGLYRACLPVESGNPKTLAFINKPVDLDRTRNLIHYCSRRGLYTYANLVIGFPYEDRADIEVTFKWTYNTMLDAVNYFVATPMPGAHMYPIYVENNWIINDAPHSADWKTQFFALPELQKLAREASRKYLVRKMLSYLNVFNAVHYLWPKISSWRKFKYFLKLARYALVGGQRPTSDAGSISVLKGHMRRLRA